MPKELMPDELLPCPFCGSSDVDHEGLSSIIDTRPACNNCGASTDGDWNARHTHTAISLDVTDLSPDVAEAVKYVEETVLSWRNHPKFVKHLRTLISASNNTRANPSPREVTVEEKDYVY